MKRTALSALLLAALLAGCTPAAQTPPEDTTPADSAAAESDSPAPSASGATEISLPCTYTVPEGWVYAADYSSSDKLFYVPEGQENAATPDNISVNVGKNRYSADEHEQFRDAILQQLLMQTQGSDAEIGGAGSYTANGETLYTFTITEPDAVTVQHYIVGEQRYALVHLTNFSGAEEVTQAAQALADSLQWT